MKKTLSIAVPAYNAERYLDQCIPTLLERQALERLDIIIVDDGSTDATAAIADRYAADYPESISVIHKENGGHGSGINAAAQVARGRYFRVLDADDWVLSENLLAHLEELDACDADVVINGFHRVEMKSKRRIAVEVPSQLQGKTKTIAALEQVLPSVRNCFTIHGITYRLETYLAAQIRLSEKVFYEDNEFTTLPFCSVHSVFFSPLFFYQYLVGNQQQSVSDQNQVARLSHLEHVLNRLCDCYAADDRFCAASRGYVLEKIATVVTAYLTTCLLRDPDRAKGRGQADRLVEHLALEHPAIYKKCLGQYQKLIKLHQLHVNGKTMDFLLDTALYRMVRNQLRK